MAKSIIRFSFPGSIVWYPDAKDHWAKILVDYLESELEIGNGTFINAEPCLTNSDNSDSGTSYLYPADQIVVEVICDLPKAIIQDEFAIRSRLITLLEDREFDFIKFHNCGPDGQVSILADKLNSLGVKPN